MSKKDADVRGGCSSQPEVSVVEKGSNSAESEEKKILQRFNTEVLKKKIIKYGYELEDIQSWERYQIIDKLMKLKGFGSKDSLSVWVEKKNHAVDELQNILDIDIFKSTNIENWKCDLNNLKGNIETTTIALVGDVGSGKSSLLNALLNTGKCIPTGCDGASVTQTVIEISANLNNNFEALIVFNNAEQWKEIIAHYDLLAIEKKDENEDNIVNESNSAGSDVKNTDFSTKLNHFIDKSLSSIDKSTCEISPCEGKDFKIICGTAEMLHNAISVFIAGKSKFDDDNICQFVNCVKIYIPNVKLLKNIKFVDLPGRGDSRRPINKTAEKYLNDCDKIWIVTPVSRCLGDDAKNIVDEKFCSRLLMEGRTGTVSFICTKTDVIEYKECLEKGNFKESQQQISVTKDAIKKNTDELKKCNPEDKKDLIIKGFELESKLKASKRKFKEECSLMRSSKVKAELADHFSNKLGDTIRVHCVSSKKYVNICESGSDEAIVFTTRDNTGIPHLLNQVELSLDNAILDFKRQEISNIFLLIHNMVNAILGSTNKDCIEQHHVSELHVGTLSRTGIINNHCEELLKDIADKYALLESQLNLREVSAINEIETTCKMWGILYKWPTYHATVCQSGIFNSVKHGEVDFNAELREVFLSFFTEAWKEFFLHVSKQIKHFKSAVIEECEKRYRDTISMSCMGSEEWPTSVEPLIEPHLQSLVIKLTRYTEKAQQATYQQMIATIQMDMHPAYEACKSVERKKGFFTTLKNTIQDHVREHKRNIARKLTTTTKVELNQLVTWIRSEVNQGCNRLMKYLDQSLVKKLNVHEEARQGEVLQKLLDVISMLFILNEHKAIIDEELQNLKKRVNEALSDLQENDEYSPLKRPKLDVHCKPK